jgi:hypothetical protein
MLFRAICVHTKAALQVTLAGIFTPARLRHSGGDFVIERIEIPARLRHAGGNSLL